MEINLETKPTHGQLGNRNLLYCIVTFWLIFIIPEVFNMSFENAAWYNVPYVLTSIVVLGFFIIKTIHHYSDV